MLYRLLSVACIVLLAPHANADSSALPAGEPQTCQWDTALGNPGGSLSAMGLWNGALYVGGSAGSSFDGIAGGVVSIDLSDDSTSALGTTELVDGFVNGFATFNPGTTEQLYIAGAFNSVRFNDVELPDSRGVVAWDGTTLSTLPGSPFAEPLVFAQAITVFNDQLVIGGAGGAVDPPQKPVLTLWDGNDWVTYREEFDGLVAPVILAMAEFDGDLYFGGRFASITLPGKPADEVFDDRFESPETSRGDGDQVVESMNIMGFDGENFFSVGGGLKRMSSPISQVLALKVFDDGSGPALYIGGRFDASVDDEPMFAVARWDGEQLSAVGNGFPMPDEVRGLEVFDDGTGPALYAVGNFTQDTEDNPVRRLARLSGGDWEEVADGAGETPNRLLQLPNGRLALAGSFDHVGIEMGFPGSGPSSGFALLDCGKPDPR